jgi:hypothetical protein
MYSLADWLNACPCTLHCQSCMFVVCSHANVIPEMPKPQLLVHSLPTYLQAIASSSLAGLLKTLTAEAGVCSRVHSSLGAAGAAMLMDSEPPAAPGTYVEHACRYVLHMLLLTSCTKAVTSASARACLTDLQFAANSRQLSQQPPDSKPLPGHSQPPTHSPWAAGMTPASPSTYCQSCRPLWRGHTSWCHSHAAP